jgi:cytochrome c oxidase assembly protein subunit 15
MEFTRNDRRFVLWAGITLVLLYLVILAGSVVRATGSGMGCPDWPKCFGLLIPPTDSSQIKFKPQHEYNKGMMIIANDTLWIAAEHFTSGEVFDRTLWKKYPKHDYAQFNAAQTWTEYINRLCGALSGLASLVLLWFAFRRRKTDKLSLWLVILHLFVIGFVAWLGKVVVDSNLKPVTITLHMLCALIMVFLMIYVRYRAGMLSNAFARVNISSGMRRLLWFSLAFTLAQIMLGTQVRQQVDTLIKTSEHGVRDTWIAMLTSQYTVHFSMAMVLTLLNIFIWLRLRRQFDVPQAKRLLHASLLIVFVTYGAGVIMHRFGIPAAVQPVHLFCAMVLAGLQFALILRTK